MKTSPAGWRVLIRPEVAGFEVTRDRPKEGLAVERFARVQAMTDKIAARPYMRRGTVLKFRTWEEFNAWKRQATSAPHATRNLLTS